MAVLSLCLVQFVDVLGVTVVVTALPAMLRDVGASASFGSLIATGYAMCFGGLLMLGARLGDRFGHRRTILASLLVFGAASVLAATATSVVTITVARCLQGAAAAGSVPSALRLLTTITAEGAPRRQAIAAWSAAGAAAGASGFVVGGIVTWLTSWRVVFWAYIPLAVLLIVSTLHSVPADGKSSASRQGLNLGGALTFTASVMAFVLGSTLLGEPAQRQAGSAGLLACAMLGLSFGWLDRRASAPLLPREVVSAPQLRQGALGAALNTFTTSSAVTLVTLYLQDTLGRGALEAAATLLPFSIAVIIGSSASAVALRRTKPQQVVAVGLAMIGAADLGLVPASGASWPFAVCAAVAGAGIGLSSVAATQLGTSVDERWRGTASGIINTAAQVGTAMGIAALLLVAAATTGIPTGGSAPPWPAWSAAAAAAFAGAAFFWTRGRAVGGPDRGLGSQP